MKEAINRDKDLEILLETVFKFVPELKASRAGQ